MQRVVDSRRTKPRPRVDLCVTVVGGGLAGCEAAWQLAKRGVRVTLLEMKPQDRSPAHSSDTMAELVCSNSLRGASLSGAVGLLKEELRCLGSLLMRCADETAVPAGRALAVDRDRFSKAVDEAVGTHPMISIERRRLDSIPVVERVVVATGPLTDGALLVSLRERGAVLNYHDAIAPLVSAQSIDNTVVFKADRYEETFECAAYLNCPFDEKGYMEFVSELIGADKTPLHEFETAPFFEGCLPIEEMAARGPLTPAHGPMKPVGLIDPRFGNRPFAVVQLRPEDAACSSYNLVGFQTRLTRAEQKRVLRMIPGLKNAVFERYGQVHRNTFVDAPRVLDDRMRIVSAPNVSLAGQITGVEGYVESIASGLYVGMSLAADMQGMDQVLPPPTTAIGGLIRHTRKTAGNYQPSNVVWAMIDHPRKKRGVRKRDHRRSAADKALEDLKTWMAR